MIVAVTGVTGFIGAQVTAALLAQDHIVHGTTRDPTGRSKIDPVVALEGAAGHLTLFSAFLGDSSSFDEAFAGCDVVIHVASPFFFDVEDPQRDLLDPAVNGTVGVLQAAQRASVRRVVVTSSTVAIFDAADGRVYTEADWNEQSSLTRNPYPYSKTLAERAAWNFVEVESPEFDLVVVNPGMVLGPSIVSSVSTSIRVIADMLNGGVYPGIPDMAFAAVDVRDVADAHVAAAEKPNASGRYLCAAGVLSMADMASILKANGFDDYKVPSLSLRSGFGRFLTWQFARLQAPGMRSLIETNVGRIPSINNAKIRTELDIRFRELQDSVVETAENLVEWGHVGRSA